MFGNLRDRAFAIEKIVSEKYEADEGFTDLAADIALDELHKNSNRTDDDIAYAVVLKLY